MKHLSVDPSDDGVIPETAAQLTAIGCLNVKVCDTSSGCGQSVVCDVPEEVLGALGDLVKSWCLEMEVEGDDIFLE